VLFCRSVLIEQWIRAKYERREFLDSSRQSYVTGHKDGFLWKRGKDKNKFALRRFVLDGTNNLLIYFNKLHVSISQLLHQQQQQQQQHHKLS